MVASEMRGREFDSLCQIFFAKAFSHLSLVSFASYSAFSEKSTSCEIRQQKFTPLLQVLFNSCFFFHQVGHQERLPAAHWGRDPSDGQPGAVLCLLLHDCSRTKVGAFAVVVFHLYHSTGVIEQNLHVADWLPIGPVKKLLSWQEDFRRKVVFHALMPVKQKIFLVIYLIRCICMMILLRKLHIKQIWAV